MSGAFGNVRGTLFKAPEMKTSKSGNEYAVGTVKVKDGDANRFWRVMAFKDAAPALMAFNDGDFVRAEGGIKVDTYEKDGQTRVSLTMLANTVEAGKAAKGGNEQGPPELPHVSKPVSRGASHMPPQGYPGLDDNPF